MKLSGKHLTCGSSFAFFDQRSLTSAASQGWYGNPPGSSTPMLTIRRDVVASRGFGGTSGRRGSTSSLVQIPDKSGLPSAVRGAGADMSTPPSVLRGTPAAELRIH